MSPETTQTGRRFAWELNEIDKMPSGQAKDQAREDWRKRMKKFYEPARRKPGDFQKLKDEDA